MAKAGIAGVLAAVGILLGTLGLAPSAGATTTSLVLGQGEAFSILGHSCGGIQEQVYATGFGADGFPTGDVYMQTRCGGSGRGGGYKTTTYSAWATVVWDWFGKTRSFARLVGAAEGISESFSAEDAYGDRIYNVGKSAFLETTSPPLTPPAAPSGVSAELSSIEVAEEQPPMLRFTVSWTPAAETAGLITSSTVTATPVGSSAPVLTATVSGPGTSVVLEPLERHTTYSIIVTNTDAEGTSQPSTPIEVSSSTKQPPPPPETCEQNSGTIKLSPGLTETPHVQTITVKGELGACDGSLPIEAGTYTAHLKSAEALTCSALYEGELEAPISESLLVKWTPSESGSSTGSLALPISEYGASLTGTLEGGPFTEPLGVLASYVSESFTGGPTCGVASGGKKAKAVKKGAFSTSPVEIGG